VEVARYDLAVIGAGPAGCSAAITAARSGKRVVLFERSQYPRHKVCGEFISPEAHETLASLLGDSSPLLSNPPQITLARLFSDGNCVRFTLDHPGWSILRRDLDHTLWQTAASTGAECRQATVERIEQNQSGFQLTLSDQARLLAGRVINATGRWSNLRRPTSTGPRWIGIKAYFSGEHAPSSSDIYFFPGGYCGVQPVSSNEVNASAMVRADVATTLEQIFAANPDLWLRSRSWELASDVMTTSPLIHAAPEPVSNGILNAGDSACFIDPFVGDGISLALRSGVLAAQAASPQQYAAEYMRRFSRAIRTASLFRKIAHGPETIRRLAAFSFRSESLRRWALNRTRGI
jgi:flavin-dependent dehydrogenase